MTVSTQAFALRLGRDLYKLLKSTAQTKGISMNELCSRLLSSSLRGSSPEEALGLRSAVPEEVLSRIFSRWRGKIEGVVLFGSAVRGELTERSDIDLLIVTRRGVRPTRGFYKAWDKEILELAARICPREISPQFVEFPADTNGCGGIWLEASLEGEILRDKRGLVRRLLLDLRNRIAHGDYKREFVHGHPYWIKGGQGAKQEPDA